MPSAILTPRSMSPHQLDNYLAKGWRPMGQQIYISDFIQLGVGEIYSVIPTRLPLQQHKWRKSQRKRLRRNAKQFTHEIGPAQLNGAKDRINARYMALHPDKSLEDLSFHVIIDNRTVFDTYECCVYEGEKLVAFSFFDRGKNSVYTKTGIYDPAYQQQGLGIYTLLLEMQWAQQQGIDYYYPGYISPEYPLFDYKLNLGELEFWHQLESSWVAHSQFEATTHSPARVLLDRLEQLSLTLEQLGYDCTIYQNVFFEMPMANSNHRAMLEQPYFLLLHAPKVRQCWIATFDQKQNELMAWSCRFDQAVVFFDSHPSPHPLFEYPLQRTELLFHYENSLDFGQALAKRLSTTTQRLDIQER